MLSWMRRIVRLSFIDCRRNDSTHATIFTAATKHHKTWRTVHIQGTLDEFPRNSGQHFKIPNMTKFDRLVYLSLPIAMISESCEESPVYRFDRLPISTQVLYLEFSSIEDVENALTYSSTLHLPSSHEHVVEDLVSRRLKIVPETVYEARRGRLIRLNIVNLYLACVKIEVVEEV
jgi:hypothetical protein